MARKLKPRKGTRQSTINKRRKGALAVIFPWLRRFGLALAVLTGIVWAGSWLYLSGALGRGGDWAQNKVLMASADMGFAVKNILVEGREHTDPNVLLAIVNVQKGDPLLSFDPKEAQELINQLSWVELVQIERRWPDTLYIGLTERTPLALWQSKKRLKLLDGQGEVIATDNLQRFADLIMLSGADAPEHAQRLIGNLNAEPEIYARVETAKRIGERRWDLVLKNGVNITLPEDDVGLALSRLAQAHEKDGVLDKDIKRIDLRETDRMSIHVKSGHVQEYKADLKIKSATNTSAGNNI